MSDNTFDVAAITPQLQPKNSTKKIAAIAIVVIGTVAAICWILLLIWGAEKLLALV